MKEAKISTHVFEHWDRVVRQTELDGLDEEYIIEMCNVSKSKTGLPYNLWIDTAGESRGNQHTHTPRIKVLVNGEWIPLEVCDDPDIPESVRKTGVKDYPGLSIVKKYVKAYKKVLLAHYYEQIDDADALRLLRTLKDYKQSEIELNDIIDTTPVFLIQYQWLPDMLVYEINVLGESKKLVETRYAMSEYELFVELDKLKNFYQPETIKEVKSL